jgi:hypothetical protein
VRLPDGRHIAIAMSLTNFANSTQNEQLENQLHLLDMGGLRQIVAFIDVLLVDDHKQNTPGCEL